MIHLSAFADEISPDLDEQIAVLERENIHFLDLRGVWNTNVLDLSDAQVRQVKQTLDTQGIGVAAIGSPIGKVPVNSPFDEHLRRFERAIELARIFETPFIRVFSFYPPYPPASATDGADPARWRNEALRRLIEMTERARAAGVILLHENEKDIYGDTIARCLDLLQNVDGLQAVFDPANFIQCGQTPYPDAYEQLQPWLRYVHVKDARADSSVVAAGEGVSRWPELLTRLRQDGYGGFFSLEPHLASAGKYQGFSGPDLFHTASQALQRLLDEMGWQWE
ncbi:MAG TPA: sugar phosphate isomerase/epimerase family protein [Ktedonobacteraceae bacterium]|nr:sugar phosphate isomerase/epimerase family protein [Ktedonobacteraceae bacterium]